MTESAADGLPAVSLLEQVPAAGLRWLVHARLTALASNAGLMARLSPLFSEERLDAYARETRLDLRRLDEAIVAGFDLGTLYLARADQDMGPVVEAFAERFVAGAAVDEPHPELIRISGVVGQTPQSLLSRRGRWVAVSSGDPMLVRVVEAYTLGKLKRSPSALRGAALGSLRGLDPTPPLRMYMPGPLQGEWRRAARGALQTANGLAVLVSPGTDDNAEVRLVVDGPFDDASSVAERLLAAWQAFAHSSTGRLFGLDQALQSARAKSEHHRVTLSARLRLEPLVSGLVDAVSAEADQIFELRGRNATR